VFKWGFVFIVTPQPPACLGYLGIDTLRTGPLQEGFDLFLVALFGQFDDHGELVVGAPEVEMVFPDKGSQLAEIAESEHHPYGREQNGQLKGNGYPRGQVEMRFTADIHRPVAVKDPADTGQGGSRTGDAINKAGRMETGLPQSQRLVHPVDRHGGIDIMDLISRGPNLLYRREEYVFVSKNANNKFFNCHTISF